MLPGEVRGHCTCGKTSSQHGYGGSDEFGFADMERLDTNLVVTTRGNPNADFSQNAWDCTGCLSFTITVSSQFIIPGAMLDFDPSTFPNPTSATACVRALMQNGGLA
jgi:hypothetical protein